MVHCPLTHNSGLWKELGFVMKSTVSVHLASAHRLYLHMQTSWGIEKWKNPKLVFYEELNTWTLWVTHIITEILVGFPLCWSWYTVKGERSWVAEPPAPSRDAPDASEHLAYEAEPGCLGPARCVLGVLLVQMDFYLMGQWTDRVHRCLGWALSVSLYLSFYRSQGTFCVFS